MALRKWGADPQETPQHLEVGHGPSWWFDAPNRSMLQKKSSEPTAVLKGKAK